MRVLITGSRHWTDYDAIHNRLAQLPPGTVIVHGACGVKQARGKRPTKSADAMADWIAERLGFVVEGWPARWDTYGDAAGPIRNSAMVKAGGDLCLAWPLPGGTGTPDCMRKARRAGIPVEVNGRLIGPAFDSAQPSLFGGT